MSSIGVEPLTPTPIQVDMNGLLPGPMNVAGADSANGAVPSQGRWSYNVNGQVRERSVDESQPWHPDGVLGPVVELPPINNGNPTIANAIAHGFAVQGVPDASRSAWITAATLGGEFSVLDASLPADIATGSAGHTGALVRNPVNSVLGVAATVYNDTIGGLAARSVQGGAYLMAGDYLQSYSMGNGGLDEAQQIMAMGDTHAALILAHPKGEGALEGEALGNTAMVLWGAMSLVDGGLGLYNDWKIGNTAAGDASFGAGTRALGGEVTTIPRNGSRLVLDQSYVSDIGNVACGPTSCAMVMNDRGQFVNISHLAQDAGLVPGVGTDVLGLSDALRQNGVSAARASFGTTIDDLAASTANGNAAIAHVNLTGDAGHFVVVDGVTTRGGQAVVAVRDPLDGQFFVPVAQFKTKFSGQAVLTDGPH